MALERALAELQAQMDERLARALSRAEAREADLTRHYERQLADAHEAFAQLWARARAAERELDVLRRQAAGRPEPPSSFVSESPRASAPPAPSGQGSSRTFAASGAGVEASPSPSRSSRRADSAAEGVAALLADIERAVVPAAAHARPDSPRPHTAGRGGGQARAPPAPPAPQPLSAFDLGFGASTALREPCWQPRRPELVRVAAPAAATLDGAGADSFRHSSCASSGRASRLCLSISAALHHHELRHGPRSAPEGAQRRAFGAAALKLPRHHALSRAAALLEPGAATLEAVAQAGADASHALRAARLRAEEVAGPGAAACLDGIRAELTARLISRDEALRRAGALLAWDALGCALCEQAFGMACALGGD